MDIAVLLVKKKRLAKLDCEQDVRGFSYTVLPFAKVCTVIWSLSGKQIQKSKEHNL